MSIINNVKDATKDLVSAGEKASNWAALRRDIQAYKEERDKWRKEAEREAKKGEALESQNSGLERENLRLYGENERLKKNIEALSSLVNQKALYDHEDAKEYKGKYKRCLQVCASAGLDMNKYLKK